jgi:hypothetical protein
VVLGVYLGTPGRYESDPDELDRSLSPGGRSRKVKRAFTPLGWLRGRVESPSRARRMGGAHRAFDFVPPPKPTDKDKKPPVKLVK